MKPEFEQLADNCIHRGGLWADPNTPYRWCHNRPEEAEGTPNTCSVSTCPIWRAWQSPESAASNKEASIER
jgi:hypothetical protein